MHFSDVVSTLIRASEWSTSAGAISLITREFTSFMSLHMSVQFILALEQFVRLVTVRIAA